MTTMCSMAQENATGCQQREGYYLWVIVLQPLYHLLCFLDGEGFFVHVLRCSHKSSGVDTVSISVEHFIVHTANLSLREALVVERLCHRDDLSKSNVAGVQPKHVPLQVHLCGLQPAAAQDLRLSKSQKREEIQGKSCQQTTSWRA